MIHTVLRTLDSGQVGAISVAFQTLPEGNIFDVPKMAANFSQDRMVPAEQLSTNIDIQISRTELTTGAQSAAGPNDIPTLQFPTLICPSYRVNSYYIRVKSMKLKSRPPRTRIGLRVLEVARQKYLEVFKFTPDRAEYLSAIQKAASEIQPDIIAEIDLSVPDFRLVDTYVILELQKLSREREKGSGIVAYAVLPLSTNDESFFEIRSITLALCRPQSPTMTIDDYLAVVGNSPKTPMSAGELVIEGLLRSTVYSSHDPLKKLFKWDTRPEVIFDDANFVDKFVNFDTHSVIIFFGRLFVTLAEILAANLEQLVGIACKVLINLLFKIDEAANKSQWYRVFFDDVLEKFVPKNPALTELSRFLIGYIARSLPESADEEMGEKAIENCRECCGCLRYLFQLMTASLKLGKELDLEFDEAAFASDVRELVTRFSVLMRRDSKELMGCQSMVCGAVPVLRDTIHGFFDDEEGTKLVLAFIQELQDTRSRFRIEAICEVCTGNFFGDYANLLMPVVVDCLATIGPELDKEFEELLELAFYGLMKRVTSRPHVNRLIHFLPRVFAINNPEHTRFLVFALYYSDDSKLEQMILEVPEKMTFYKGILRLIKGIVKPASPSYILFVSVNLFVRVLSLSQKPEFNFLHAEIDELIVSVAGFYNSFLKVFGAMPDCDRAFAQRVYHPELGPIAALLPSLLKSVPPESRFNSGVLLPLIHFFVSQQDKLTRASIVDGFFLVVEADYVVDKALSRSENAIISAMDEVSNSIPNLSALTILFDAVQARFSDPSSLGDVFRRVTQLARVLSDLSQFPNDRQFEDERSSAISAVLNSYRANKDYRLFPHFTSKLFELHVIMDNKVEAAESLCMCAEIFDWSGTELVGEGHGCPEQTQGERKRLLLHKAVELFMQSDFHERALAAIEQLLDFYYNTRLDYATAALLHDQERRCWEGICNMERNNLNRFYGARFYGRHFNQYYRDGLFIYRRNGFYMNDQMTRELKEKFPDVRIDPKPPTDEELADPELYYVHLFNVKPRELDSFDPYAPPSETMIKSVCNVTEFYSETPVRRRLCGNYGEFAEWHRHVYRYTVDFQLQGPIRRATVIEVSPLIEMTPVECAIFDTNAKTIELMMKACMYWRCVRYDLKYQEAAVSAFLMLTSGIVSAAVNGGTKVFQEVFLESDLKYDPQVKKFAPDLKRAFADQLKAVRFALRVHWNVISPDYIPLYENLKGKFQEMQTVMFKAIGTIDLSAPATFGEIPSTDYREFCEEDKNEA
jgi:hypothetical protein